MNSGAARDRPVDSKALITGEATGGRLAMIELWVERRFAPPCHRHLDADEVLAVLDGEILLQLGAARQCVGAGMAVLLPRGVEHGFAVLSPRARVVTAFMPSGFEGFFQEMAGIGSPSLDRVVATAARYACEITGPPVRAGADDPIG